GAHGGRGGVHPPPLPQSFPHTPQPGCPAGQHSTCGGEHCSVVVVVVEGVVVVVEEMVPVTRSYPMTSRLIPSGELCVTSDSWSGQLNAFWTNGVTCGQGPLNQSPKCPLGA